MSDVSNASSSSSTPTATQAVARVHYEDSLQIVVAALYTSGLLLKTKTIKFKKFKNCFVGISCLKLAFHVNETSIATGGHDETTVSCYQG